MEGSWSLAETIADKHAREIFENLSEYFGDSVFTEVGAFCTDRIMRGMGIDLRVILEVRRESKGFGD